MFWGKRQQSNLYTTTADFVKCLCHRIKIIDVEKYRPIHFVAAVYILCKAYIN
jgi:hypothetical protein